MSGGGTAERRAGRHVAELIRAGARAHAAGAVLRHGVQAGDGEGSSSFEDLVQDAEHRLRCLAEALVVGRPELFHEHVRWAKVAFAARGLDDDFLPGSLAALREELTESLPPGASELAAEMLDRAESIAREAPSELPSLLEGEGREVDLARRFLLCVLEGRGADAVRLVVSALEEGTDVEVLYAVTERVQREVGRMWQMGELSIAEEHFGSRVVESVVARLQEHLPREDGRGRTVLLATVGGDLHDIGPRMVADHFEMAGWRVLYLGANTPTPDILRAAAEHAVDVIAVSASLGESATAVAEICSAVRRDLGEERPRILVGGRLFSEVEGLWRDVGADGCTARAADAPRVAAGLVG